jgi:hypothetical protein
MKRHYGLEMMLGALLFVAPSVASSQDKQPSQLKQQASQEKQQASQRKQSCASIRSLDGRCVDATLLEKAERRAGVISSNQASYSGTPLGTVGLRFIPHERLFRDDPVLFGIPSSKTKPFTP